MGQVSEDNARIRKRNDEFLCYDHQWVITMKIEEYKSKEWLQGAILKYGSFIATAENTEYNRKTISKYAKKFGIENPESSRRERKYALNESYFNRIDSEEKAYWLGFIVADGCLYHHKTSYDIQFSLSLDDFDHMIKFAEAIGSEKIPEVKDQEDKQITFFRVSSKKMFNDLLNLGVTSNKTGNEHFPDIPKEMTPHFIRGYFDGDGCISYYDVEDPYTFNIVCASKDFLSDIAKNIFNSIGETLVPYKVRNHAYIINSVAKRKNYFIYKYIYKNSSVSLERKHKKIESFLRKYSPLYE